MITDTLQPLSEPPFRSLRILPIVIFWSGSPILAAVANDKVSNGQDPMAERHRRSFQAPARSFPIKLRILKSSPTCVRQPSRREFQPSQTFRRSSYLGLRRLCLWRGLTHRTRPVWVAESPSSLVGKELVPGMRKRRMRSWRTSSTSCSGVPLKQMTSTACNQPV